MWPCYGVHIHCVHGTSCFCTLSASAFMYWTIPTWARFLFRNHFMETCMFLFFFDNNLLTIIVTWYRPRNCCWCVIRARVHWWMVSNSQYALPSQSSPQKITGVRSQLRSIFREFPGYWWIFWTKHLLCYGARIFEEERKKERKKERRWMILTFNRFRFATLK